MTLAYALAHASHLHDVSGSDILGRSRSRSIVAARWHTWRMLHRHGWTRADIARAFNVDWSTVNHATRETGHNQEGDRE